MEIVFAILILIGAVVSGSNPPTSQEVQPEKQRVADSEQTTVVRSVKAMPGPCRFPGGRLIQRDLTVPRASTTVTSGVNPEEVEHGCGDQ